MLLKAARAASCGVLITRLDNALKSRRSMVGQAVPPACFGGLLLNQVIDDNANEVPAPNAPAPRKLGTAKGDFVVPPDFNDPFPDSILDEFEK